VALLLIAILATDNLSETAKATKLIARLRPSDREGVCPITGAKTFASALAALLSSASLVSAVHKIDVARDQEKARIDWIEKDGSFLTSYFGTKLNAGGPLYVSAELVPFPLAAIAKVLHGETK
jgi:hypothetical protein